MSNENFGHAAAPATTPSACFGYPAGTWPRVISPFCSDTAGNRHEECTVPGCNCSCHSQLKA